MRLSKVYNEHIVANIPSNILILDKNLKFIFFNHVFYNNFKTNHKTIIGKPLSDIIPSELLNNLRIEEKTSETFKSGKTVKDLGLEIDASKFTEPIDNLPFFNQDRKLLNISYTPLIKEKEAEHVMIIIDDITGMKKSKEKVMQVTKKIPLTENEKLIFYGIIKYPYLTDQQLSDKLRIKRSTVTAIKNRLKKENFFMVYNIPNFKFLEKTAILTIILCRFNPDSKESMRAEVAQKLTSQPELMYNYTTDEQCYCVFVSKNYAEIKKMLDPIILDYEEKNIITKNWLLAYFPFEISKLSINFSDLLKNLFEINIEERKEENKTGDVKTKELSKNEKIILCALTKWPDITDSELSKKISISRPTISTARKFLFENNYLKTIIHPNLTKLGYELLVLDYSIFKPSLKREEKEKEIELLISQPQLTFLILGDTDFAALNLFKDYEEYSTFMSKLRTFTAKQIMECIPISKIEFQNIKFAPLIKKILNLSVSF